MAKLNAIGGNFVQLQSKNPFDRINAVYSLGAVQFTCKLKPATSEQITNGFVAALNDKFRRVRVTAISELAANNCGEERILDILSAALKKDGSHIGSNQLSEIISYMVGSEYGISTVARMLADRSFPNEVRSASATKLGHAGENTAEVRNSLEEGAKDPDTTVSVFSKLSLAKINQCVAQE